LLIATRISILLLSLEKAWLSSRIGVRIKARKRFAIVYTFIVLAPGMALETYMIMLGSGWRN
jgi:hypothetical protein